MGRKFVLWRTQFSEGVYPTEPWKHLFVYGHNICLILLYGPVWLLPSRLSFAHCLPFIQTAISVIFCLLLPVDWDCETSQCNPGSDNAILVSRGKCHCSKKQLKCEMFTHHFPQSTKRAVEAPKSNTIQFRLQAHLRESPGLCGLNCLDLCPYASIMGMTKLEIQNHLANSYIYTRLVFSFGGQFKMPVWSVNNCFSFLMCFL